MKRRGDVFEKTSPLLREKQTMMNNGQPVLAGGVDTDGPFTEACFLRK